MAFKGSSRATLGGFFPQGRARAKERPVCAATLVGRRLTLAILSFITFLFAGDAACRPQCSVAEPLGAVPRAFHASSGNETNAHSEHDDAVGSRCAHASSIIHASNDLAC